MTREAADQTLAALGFVGTAEFFELHTLGTRLDATTTGPGGVPLANEALAAATLLGACAIDLAALGLGRQANWMSTLLSTDQFLAADLVLSFAGTILGDALFRRGCWF